MYIRTRTCIYMYMYMNIHCTCTTLCTCIYTVHVSKVRCTLYVLSNVCEISDLRTNYTLNEMAKAMSPIANTSKRFGMEDFDYKNTVIVERMMYNWQTTSFIGVTVRGLIYM